MMNGLTSDRFQFPANYTIEYPWSITWRTRPGILSNDELSAAQILQTSVLCPAKNTESQRNQRVLRIDIKMIKLSNLSMSYALGESLVEVLRDIDLRIEPGERIAIAGPSGSGKTTLLLLLAGLERPSAGTVAFDGLALEQLDRDQLADLRRDHIGIVFQSFHLVPSLSALDNVALPLEIAGRRDARTRAEQLLVKVGLGARQRHYPSQLSGGEQQRVAIARALVHEPKLVLADEPTGNLDEHTGEEIADLLFKLNRDSHSTLVLVTHDTELAGRCDRILRLHEGALSEPISHADAHSEEPVRVAVRA